MAGFEQGVGFPITAHDAFSGAFDKLQSKLTGLQGGVARLNGVIATIGIAGGFAGIAALIKNTLDAHEEVNKLSQKLGIAVGELSQYKYALGLSDVSMEAFGKSVKSLNQRMIEAGDGTSKAGRLLSMMGVDLNKGATPAIERIADTFALLPDGVTKGALAVELFGKAGMDMIPFLNQGSEGIRKMKDEALRLGLVMSEESTRAAEQFNDNLKTIQASSQRLSVSLVNELALGLVNISNAMKEAAMDSGVLKAIWVGMGGVLAEAFGMNADPAVKRLREINKELVDLQEKIAAGPRDLGGGVKDRSFIIQYTEKIKALREELVLLKAQMDKTWRPQEGGAFDFGGSLNRPAAANEARIRGILGGGDAGVKGLSEFARAFENLRAKILGAAQGMDSQFPQSLATLNMALALGKISLGEHASLTASLIEQQPFYKKGLDDETRLLEHRNNLLRVAQQAAVDEINARDEILNALKDRVAELRTENAVIGMTDQARKLYLIGLEREKALKFADEADVAKINRYYDEIEALTRVGDAQRQIQDQQRESARGWEDLADRVIDGVKDMGSALKRFRDELVALFLKKYFLQIVAGATGNSVLASQAGAMGSNTISGMTLNAAGSYIGGAGTAIGGAYGAAEGFAMGWGSGVAGPAAGFAESAGAWMSTLGSTGWGLIIVAAIAVVAAILSNRGGGPKVEGSSVGSFDAAGNPLGAYHVSDEYGNRFLRGTQMDSALDPLTAATGAGYRNLVARLGGTFGTAGFGFGASNDPAGDARSRVFGSAMVNGRSVFSSAVDVDDKEVDAMLALTSKRAILAALQATDFDDEIDKIFAAAGDVARLTGEQIDAIIAQAREMHGVIQGLQALDLTGLDVEALRGFAAEGESIGQTFQRVGGAWLQLTDAFTSQDTKIEQAQGNLLTLYTQLTAIGVELPTTREGFLDIMRSLDLSTESGRSLFTAMMNLAPAFDMVTAAAETQLSAFDELMGRLRPGYSGNLAQLSISSSIGEFMGANAWTQGMSQQDFLVQLRTITRDDFRGYSAANQRLILSILTLDASISGTTNALTGLADVIGASASTAFTGNIYDANYRPGPTWEWNGRMWINTDPNPGGSDASRARQGLGSYLGGLGLNQQLSPLDPWGQLQEGVGIFDNMLIRAQGGDADAISGLPAIIEQILGLGRSVWGSSSAYVDFFNSIRSRAGAVVGAGRSEASFQLDEAKLTNRHFVDVKALLHRIAEGIDHNTDVTADASYESGDKVAGAIANSNVELR